jgi:hypothetical protein
MRLNTAVVGLLLGVAYAAPAPLVKRQQFAQGEPIDGTGKGAPILGSIIHFVILYTNCDRWYQQTPRSSDPRQPGS